MELVFQELIEAEAAEVIGAGRYERSETRVTERNGHRPSFERDIVPLFRAEDRFAMSGFFDLISYEEVRSSATLIYER